MPMRCTPRADQTCLCAKLFTHTAPFMPLKKIIAKGVNNSSSPPTMIHREEAERCVNEGYEGEEKEGDWEEGSTGTGGVEGQKMRNGVITRI